MPAESITSYQLVKQSTVDGVKNQNEATHAPTTCRVAVNGSTVNQRMTDRDVQLETTRVVRVENRVTSKLFVVAVWTKDTAAMSMK